MISARNDAQLHHYAGSFDNVTNLGMAFKTNITSLSMHSVPTNPNCSGRNASCAA